MQVESPEKGPIVFYRAFFVVRQAWRFACKRNQLAVVARPIRAVGWFPGVKGDNQRCPVFFTLLTALLT